MASNQTGRAKKRSSGKARAPQKTGKKYSKKRTTAQNEPIQDEINLIIIFLISLLLLLSILGLCGPFGRVIKSILFGMTGFATYLIPFLLFFLAAFILANRGNVLARHKIISFFVLLFAVTALLQMISGYQSELHFWEYYIECADKKNGGGLLGGILVSILCPIFGKIATVIILIVIVLLCVIFITGKAIVTRISRASGEKIKQHQERRALYAQQYEEMEEREREALLQPRKARTVTLAKQETLYNSKISEPKAERIKKGGFLDQLKKKGSLMEEENKESVAPTVQEPLDEFVDLKEIKIVGQEAAFEPSREMLSEVNSIYEEELGKKDADNVETMQPQNIADGLPGDNEPPVKKTESIKKEHVEPLVIDASVKPEKKYVFPPLSLLAKPRLNQRGMTEKDLKETAIKLQKTLDSFGVHVTVTNISCGPSVTRYELAPEQGVKVSRITGLADDIKLNLAAADVRIEAPIPGKAAVGIEVPNKENSTVMFRELLDSKEFKMHKSSIAFAVGKDIGGQCVVSDIAKMPHLLIAGATGSGKSVCINTLIMSILYKAEPSDVRLIMVDPKVVELSVYNGIPHLLIPVVTDPKKASAALNWAVVEMNDRYKKFAQLSVRDLKGYNDKVLNDPEVDATVHKKLPQIVIIVDELADLMMVAPGEVEDAICRLAQMARAAGLHLIIATQRPSVNVITGVIKANVPSRIAFSVSSAIDSRTIIDGSGAEKLLGKGDMLFFPSGYPKPIRVQGAFVSDKEVSAVVDFLKKENEEHGYSEEVSQQIQNVQSSASQGASSSNDRDEYFVEAARFIIEKDKASIGMLQRVYKIGFNRAARIMEQLSDAGVVGPDEGTKPRKILMSMEEFEQYIEEYV